jgi:hypothetical protein
MDESDQELETELKSLRLRAPAPRLLDGIAQKLAADPTPVALGRQQYTTATNWNSWKWFGWRTAGIAAALALVVGLSFMRRLQTQLPDSTTPAAQPVITGPVGRVQSTSPIELDRYRPVAASNVLYDLKDEGPVNVVGDAPARRLRYRYLDTYTWKNPRSNASIKWSVPRDEIRVLPVSMN